MLQVADTSLESFWICWPLRRFFCEMAGFLPSHRYNPAGSIRNIYDWSTRGRLLRLRLSCCCVRHFPQAFLFYFTVGLRLDFPSNTAQPTGRLPPEIADRLEIRFTAEMANAIEMEIERNPAKMLRPWQLIRLTFTDFDISSVHTYRVVSQ